MRGAGITEVLTIQEGSLGPVPPSTLSVRPFTVLIGKQGTGKSLVAQVLYFFRALPFLVSYQEAMTRKPSSNGSEPRAHDELLLHNILSDLRSSGRSFASFANPTVALGWEDLRLPLPASEARGVPTLHLRRAGHRVVPDRALRRYIAASREGLRKDERAIFIPAERIIYSQIKSPAALQLLSLPSTFLFFAAWMERAAKIQDAWENGVPDTIGGRWIRARSKRVLGGAAERRADAWTWKMKQGKRVTRLPIDMASSGQRASFSLVLLAEALLSLRASGAIPEGMTIYVEEPEIHLHPEAQVAMVEILAYLVNEGFHVVVATHSLTVLYALNNLILSSELGEERATDVPAKEVRLAPSEVAAFVFDPAGVTDIVDRETGFISEAELGRVAEDLSEQMNAIAMLKRQAGAEV